MRTRSCQAGLSAKRPGRHNISYKEPSIDGSDSEISDELHSYGRTALLKKVRANTGSLPTMVSNRKRKSQRRTRSTQPVVKKLKTTPLPREENLMQVPTFSSGRVMPWQTLPYEVLLQIFHFASQPLWTDLFLPTRNISWLLNTALICKSFAEPALSVLYYSPPLSPPSRARGLLTQLAAQSSTSTYNYRSKIKYLEIEVSSVLLHKYVGLPPLNLDELIEVTPQLRGIAIHLQSDQPQHVMVSSSLRKIGVVYKDSLFDGLRKNNINLLTWKWNFMFNQAAVTSDSYPWGMLKDLHLQAPLQSIRNLEIARYNRKSSMDELYVAKAINALPNLSRLNINSCDFLDDAFLSLLPRHLESLHISVWPSLTSDRLHPFLLTHGSNLRELILDHNQSLNIDFLVDFASACPYLEIFKINMSFYSLYATFPDSEPKFEILLTSGRAPTWPTTLQVLELLQLRKWTLASAELFITSLVESASELLQLRRLVLKTSIEIGWRDRATFRDQWIGKLRKVFLRISPPPTISPSKFVATGTNVLREEANSRLPQGTDESRSRRSGLRNRQGGSIVRVEIPKDVLDTETESDTPIAPQSTRRSSRLKDLDAEDSIKHRNGRGSQKEAKVSEPTSHGVEEETDIPSFIQGMCDVVDIRIDNLRPAQVQFSENDFLDEPLSGDEDWNSDDSLPVEGYAW